MWGSLPEGWRTGQVKNVASVTLGKMLQGKDSGDDVLAPYMRAANVQPDGVLALNDAKEMWFDKSELSALDLRRGDVVVVEGGQGGFGRAAFITDELTGWGFQNSINRLRPATGCDGRYLAYFLIALRASGFIRDFCNIVSMPHFTAEKLARTPMPLPPPGEQRAIANFLDRETTRIDTLIARQEQLIATLGERRGAVLESALLDFSWDTPLHSSVSLIQTGPFGSQLKSDEYEIGGVPVINPSHMIAGRIKPDTGIAVSADKATDLSRHKFYLGDVVVARRGELGRCAVVSTDAVGDLCGTGSAIVRPRPTRLDSEFLAMVYRSRRNKDSLALASVGSTMANVNSSIIGALRIPLPPLADQRRLVEETVKRTAKIDALLWKTEQFIKLAKGRRSALITAAVTGQLDLRSEVA